MKKGICLFLCLLLPVLSEGRSPAVVEGPSALTVAVRSSLTRFLSEHAGIPGAEAWVGDIRFSPTAGMGHSLEVVRIVPYGTMRSGRNVLFTLYARSPKGEVRGMRVSADVSVMVPVVVSARNLQAGALVVAEDVFSRKMEIAGGNTDFLHRADDAVGKRIRWPLVAGVPLRRSFLEDPESLKRGDTVVLVAESGTVRITGKAVSLQAGNVGDTVLVRNVSSGREQSGELMVGHVVRID